MPVPLALPEEDKDAFLSCVESHQKDGTYPKPNEFKINSVKPDGYLPETLYATRRFSSHDGRMVLYGVGVHYDKDNPNKLRYESRLKYDVIKGKINFSDITEAEKYFPRALLEEITENCRKNRPKKEEEARKKKEEKRQKDASIRKIIAPLPRAPMKKKDNIRGSRLAEAERKARSFSRKNTRPVQVSATRPSGQ